MFDLIMSPVAGETSACSVCGDLVHLHDEGVMTMDSSVSLLQVSRYTLVSQLASGLSVDSVWSVCCQKTRNNSQNERDWGALHQPA